MPTCQGFRQFPENKLRRRPDLTLEELLEPKPGTSAAPRFTEAELQKFVHDLRDRADGSLSGR